MDEEAIRAFWEENPCGDGQVGGLRSAFKNQYADFFREYDAFRYRREGHILRCLDEIDFKGKEVLDVGLGEGADSEQIIRRGAAWTGLDITREACERTKLRLQLRELTFDKVIQASMLCIPCPDESFDMVFCHGALPCVPDIHGAQKEFARVLKPRGELIVMLYAKGSLNYLLSIGLLRRIGLAFLYFSHVHLGGFYDVHVENARKAGLLNYLKMKNFVHKNTDGPFNPYTRLHWVSDLDRDFPLFHIDRWHKEFMHAPPLPVRKIPLSHIMGWHLWAHMRKK